MANLKRPSGCRLSMVKHYGIKALYHYGNETWGSSCDLKCIFKIQKRMITKMTHSGLGLHIGIYSIQGTDYTNHNMSVNL